MAATIQIIRTRRMKAQGGVCFYCGFPVWTGDPSDYIRQTGLTRKQAERFRCTAEHLTARCDGGTDAEENIVAACHFCNQTRHATTTPMPADKYREKVRCRLARGKWHMAALRCAGRLRRPTS